MKKIGYILGSTSALVLPFIASAAFDPDNNAFGTLLRELVDLSNKILIPFILAIGFLVFVWGMFRYFIAGGANEEARESGRSLMIYATLGFVLIIIFWGIINLLSSSTGLQGKTAPDIPTGPNKQQT